MTSTRMSPNARAAIALAAVMGALASFAMPAAARPLDDVLASKVIKVIAYDDNKPFSWTEDGVVKGIDVDLARALAKDIGVEAEVILRIQGEEVDDDLRAHLVRGPLTGGGIGDILMHVPTDREFAMRNKEVVIGNPYFQETVAVAIDPKKVPKDADFNFFKSQKIGVKLATVSDYFLMTFDNGALINNVSHFIKAQVGLKSFIEGETVAMMGVRSEMEGQLKDAGASAEFIRPNMEGIFQESWVVGFAVDEKSRDLSYALGQSLAKLKDSGALKDIFAKYGVTYIPPPGS
ncbi:MAG: substrate-binding periplasmic protein [Hyphomicrobium sp.]